LSLSRAALKNQIAAGETGPLYVLLGDDDSEKSAVAAEFAEMVDEGLRAFSVDRLFGAESKADDLIDAAATLPMMAPRRIVIVLDAERLLISEARRESSGRRAGTPRGVRQEPAGARHDRICLRAARSAAPARQAAAEGSAGRGLRDNYRFGGCRAMGDGEGRAWQDSARRVRGANTRGTGRGRHRPAQDGP
jgi:hypothetical protein